MMTNRRVAAALSMVCALALGAGCDKKTAAGQGLPPAQQWSADPAGGATQAMPAPSNPTGAAPHNPHEGVPGAPDLSQATTAPGTAQPGPVDPNGPNPHAGQDMSGAGGPVDVKALGLPPPDPNKPIDPNRYIRGVITVDAKARGRVKPGTAVFVIAKRMDASGAPSGPPLAVERLTMDGDVLAFELTEAQAMIAGTELSGDIVLSARYDQDSDAMSRQPGDITGQVQVKVPAKDVSLVLDTVLP